MSKSLNRFECIGNLGSDPQVGVTRGGTKVANVSIATTRTWKNNSGQKQEATEWHRCIFWGAAAEIIEQYAGVGDRVFVDGELRYKKWTAPDETRPRTDAEIHVSDFILLSSKNKSAPTNERVTRAPSANDDDDDLPF